MHDERPCHGKPGARKTSLIETVARKFSQVAGASATSEIRERGVRKRFRVTTLDGYFSRPSKTVSLARKGPAGTKADILYDRFSNKKITELLFGTQLA
jgi:nucleoside-triphosphatase THEP1